MLNVSLAQQGATAVATLSGRLDAAGAPLFDTEISRLTPQTRTLVIDFCGVEYLSSAGLRSLITAAKRLRPSGGDICLCGLKPFLLKVLQLSGMTHFFKIKDSLDEACAEASCTAAALETQQELVRGNRRLHLHTFPATVSTLELWGSYLPEIAANPAPSAADLTQATLDELGLAIGLAGFGATRDQALAGLGRVLAGWNVAGMLDERHGREPDFVTTERPDETTLFIANAIAISGQPQAYAECIDTAPDNNGFTLAELLQDLELPDLLPQNLPLALALFAENLNNAPAAFVLCLSLPATAHAPELDASNMADLPWTEVHGRRCVCLGLTLDCLPPNKGAGPRETLNQTLKNACTLDALAQVAFVTPEARMSRATVWAFAPATVRSGQEKRLRIEVKGGVRLLDDWDYVIRRIYGRDQDAADPAGGHEVARVVLTPLHGGFSSQNFSVDSFDRDGKRLIPTVLKIGHPELVRREEEAYHRYVKRFILNNSAAIMGSATHGDWAGLRYNFVGIAGPGSSLTWLTKLYQTRPAEELIPIFDRIFTTILKPWYGQPRWETIHPYADHDPTRIFTSICDDAARELGIDPDAQGLDCPELGRVLPNPFRFLKDEFPKRRGKSQLWYTSVTHNDLNMQNILLDERENIYIIDFSETRYKNIVADFARLEPIFLLEMTAVDTDDDVAALTRFIDSWYKNATYDHFPAFDYQGSDPMVEKAYRLMQRCRRYADICTLFETDLTPYLLGVLEWTICVVSYGGISVVRKRLAAYMSGIICEMLLKDEN